MATKTKSKKSGTPATAWFYSQSWNGPRTTPAEATPKAVPSETGLYLGDNGRVTCSKMGCAGMTAFYAGMRSDLSGGPMDALSVDDVRAMEAALSDRGLKVTCQTCGAPPLMGAPDFTTHRLQHDPRVSMADCSSCGGR